MLKFIHRKHFNKLKGEGRIVVYYSLSEIILGVLLLFLVTFFVIDYLHNNFNKNNSLNVKEVVGMDVMPTKALIKGK